jgi:putative hemolysin
MLYLEIFIVFLLTVINGLLAMSELAVVSSRKARLDHMAGSGNRGARLALRLIEDPGRFLSTVQIGITLVGIFAGAFSGATLATRLGDWLNSFPFIAPHGEEAGVVIVVIGITYLSLIVGELVPKRIAMSNPERVAATIAGPMQLLSRLAAPAVWLLKYSTELILRALGLADSRGSAVTEEEVKSLIAEGAQSGIFMPQEHRMLEGVMRMADRSVRAIMTPRTDIVWIDVNAALPDALKTIEESNFSRLLVCENSIDQAIGVIHAKNLVAAALRGEQVSLRDRMINVSAVSDRSTILKVLDHFRREKLHIAVVVDEYGTTEGIVTITDVLESIAGDLPEYGEEVEIDMVRRKDGSWLIDGMMPIDEFEDRTGMRGLQNGGEFHTLAGFVLQHLGHLPKPGEGFVFRDARFEVIDMDGRRIDKILYVPGEDADAGQI